MNSAAVWKALKFLHFEFGGLRTGRATAAQGKGKFTVIKDKK
jgi:hypothetical protein